MIETTEQDENMKNQTVRHMLMMSTGSPLELWNWFETKAPDRVKAYFDKSVHNPHQQRIPGCIFEYDSWGSFVLGALVEKKTGKKLMDYLREKMFDKIRCVAGSRYNLFEFENNTLLIHPYLLLVHIHQLYT